MVFLTDESKWSTYERLHAAYPRTNQIEALLKTGHSQTRIANVLAVHKSTISREAGQAGSQWAQGLLQSETFQKKIDDLVQKHNLEKNNTKEEKKP